jgi:fatty acid synthase subunit alpha
MTNVLNYLKVKKVDLAKVSPTVCAVSIDTHVSQLSEKFTIEEVKKMLGEIIDSCFSSAQEKQKKDGYIVLERGFATIPLPGIDVPFHSRYLWAGVMPFRACKLVIC